MHVHIYYYYYYYYSFLSLHPQETRNAHIQAKNFEKNKNEYENKYENNASQISVYLIDNNKMFQEIQT